MTQSAAPPRRDPGGLLAVLSLATTWAWQRWNTSCAVPDALRLAERLGVDETEREVLLLGLVAWVGCHVEPMSRRSGSATTPRSVRFPRTTSDGWSRPLFMLPHLGTGAPSPSGPGWGRVLARDQAAKRCSTTTDGRPMNSLPGSAWPSGWRDASSRPSTLGRQGGPKGASGEEILLGRQARRAGRRG